jgi:hypothetical protein
LQVFLQMDIGQAIMDIPREAFVARNSEIDVLPKFIWDIFGNQNIEEHNIPLYKGMKTIVAGPIAFVSSLRVIESD